MQTTERHAPYGTVRVAVDVPFAGEGIFDYHLPPSLEGEVKIGSRLLVPLSSRQVEGYAVEVIPVDDRAHLKDIIAVLDEAPPLTPELIALARHIAGETGASLYRALLAMVPTFLKSKRREIIVWSAESMPLIVLPEEEALLLYVKKRGRVPKARLVQIFPDALETIARFEQMGWLKTDYELFDRSRSKQQKAVRLVSDAENKMEREKLRGVKQRAVIEALLGASDRTMTQDELFEKTGATHATLQSLVARELIIIDTINTYRRPEIASTFVQSAPHVLNTWQARALDTLMEGFQRGGDQPYVLHGVTGSGKTEVYMAFVERILNAGKNALILVPEISLTPQMVARFTGRFGESVAVLHSALSDGERYDEWRRIRQGEARVVVGARSAIFAPLSDIGAIIIDEEHEASYKQEEMPRYHAHRVAMWRARHHRAVLVLGSATPLLETYAYALAGRYKLIELPERANRRPLPEVRLIDLKKTAQPYPLLSEPLKAAISERLMRGEQTILLLNRRGFASVLMCRACGHTIGCPHCDVTLTYHRGEEKLLCHYCGYNEPYPERCPRCHAPHLRPLGVGTERMEETLKTAFPEARILRMDRDTTSRKGKHEELLGAFHAGEADILLGTQMIAKGLDFPKVTLVGVMLADMGLFVNDFRAAERTFQLITQVSGRAGRGTLPGEVIVQTYHPEHPSLRLAERGDYQTFVRQELDRRKAAHYPPFYRLALIKMAHRDPAKVKTWLSEVTETLRAHVKQDTEVIGPAPAERLRLRDRYHYHTLIKYRHEQAMSELIARVFQPYLDVWRKHAVEVSLDIDPYTL
ncbi:MAG: primosomal protein N' [Candidatus Carbobacillus altaicus]|nr:primosomal protein N' [Candidatus Carbobacillus altaicus]